MRIAVIVDAVADAGRLEDPSAGSASVEHVAAALCGLGHEPVVVAFAADAASWLEQLLTGDFGAVFNLCEGLAGHAALEHLPAAAVELLGVPMTGARAFTLALCLRKDITGAVLRAHGIAIPAWTVARAGESTKPWRHFPAIVKPVAEDASIGIGSDSVVHGPVELAAALERGHRRWERMLVQTFVPGREFNLAIVGRHALPPAEMDFGGLPGGLPAVVSYAAKWHPGSLEDRGTQPTCPARLSPRLTQRLHRLARQVWGAVEGVGYGRVDVRMSDRGTLYVIDVNPNPDLSPEAGLARQAAAAGWSYTDLIAAIVDDALDRSSRRPTPRCGHRPTRCRRRRPGEITP